MAKQGLDSLQNLCVPLIQASVRAAVQGLVAGGWLRARSPCCVLVLGGLGDAGQPSTTLGSSHPCRTSRPCWQSQAVDQR